MLVNVTQWSSMVFNGCKLIADRAAGGQSFQWVAIDDHSTLMQEPLPLEQQKWTSLAQNMHSPTINMINIIKSVRRRRRRRHLQMIANRTLAFTILGSIFSLPISAKKGNFYSLFRLMSSARSKHKQIFRNGLSIERHANANAYANKLTLLFCMPICTGKTIWIKAENEVLLKIRPKSIGCNQVCCLLFVCWLLFVVCCGPICIRNNPFPGAAR